MKTQFPKEIVVSIENEGQGEDQYLQVNESFESVAEVGSRKRAALYVLQHEATVTSRAQVEIKRK